MYTCPPNSQRDPESCWCVVSSLPPAMHIAAFSQAACSSHPQNTRTATDAEKITHHEPDEAAKLPAARLTTPRGQLHDPSKPAYLFILKTIRIIWWSPPDRRGCCRWVVGRGSKQLGVCETGEHLVGHSRLTKQLPPHRRRGLTGCFSYKHPQLLPGRTMGGTVV